MPPGPVSVRKRTSGRPRADSTKARSASRPINGASGARADAAIGTREFTSHQRDVADYTVEPNRRCLSSLMDACGVASRIPQHGPYQSANRARGGTALQSGSSRPITIDHEFVAQTIHLSFTSRARRNRKPLVKQGQSNRMVRCVEADGGGPSQL